MVSHAGHPSFEATPASVGHLSSQSIIPSLSESSGQPLSSTGHPAGVSGHSSL